jgi:hypothetical protein
MIRGGSDEAGFVIDVGVVYLSIHVWGFWDAATAAEFGRAGADAVRTSTRTQLVVDATRLKPQRDDGEAALRSVIEATASSKLVRAEVRVGNAITRMQLARLVREKGAGKWTFAKTLTAGEGG